MDHPPFTPHFTRPLYILAALQYTKCGPYSTVCTRHEVAPSWRPDEKLRHGCRRACRPSCSRSARWFLYSGLPRAGSQRTSRASSPASGRPARPPSRRPLRPCVASPACLSSCSAALTRTPRRLRGVRADSAYQPPAMCTYRRRRAACPQGLTYCVPGTRARLGRSGTVMRNPGAPGAGRSRGRDAQLGPGLVEHAAPARWP